MEWTDPESKIHEQPILPEYQGRCQTCVYSCENINTCGSISEVGNPGLTTQEGGFLCMDYIIFFRVPWLDERTSITSNRGGKIYYINKGYLITGVLLVMIISLFARVYVHLKKCVL